MKVPLGTAVIVMKESRKETQRCAVVGTEVVKVKKRNVNWSVFMYMFYSSSKDTRVHPGL